LYFFFPLFYRCTLTPFLRFFLFMSIPAFALNLLWRRREATRCHGPASNEVLANVFQPLLPRSIAACCAVCLKWSVLLSSPRLVSLAGWTACFASLGGANAGRARRRRGDTVTAATWFPLLAKRQHRRSKEEASVPAHVLTGVFACCKI
jgi:hypothetical protein